MEVDHESCVALFCYEPTFDVDVVGGGDADLFAMQVVFGRVAVALGVIFGTVSSVWDIWLSEMIPGMYSRLFWKK